MYEKLIGGYLSTRYAMSGNEEWQRDLDLSDAGTEIDLVVQPHVEGSRSLRIILEGAKTIVVRSEMASDFSDTPDLQNGGVGLLTYVVATEHSALATLRMYTDQPSELGGRSSWFEFSWPIATQSGGGFYAYGGVTSLYGLAKYGYNQNVDYGDWNIVTIPHSSFTLHGTPSWGDISAVELELVSDGSITAFVDGISSWHRLTGSYANANQFISVLPEYHRDQDYNDVIATAAGYSLDALRQMLDLEVLSTAQHSLEIWEDAMGLPRFPLLWSRAKRRDFMLAINSRPRTKVELERALSLGMGRNILVVEDFADSSIEVVSSFAPESNSAELLRVLVSRLKPAHLGVRYALEEGGLAPPVIPGTPLNSLRLHSDESMTTSDAASITT
jgi:hypothetical protein